MYRRWIGALIGCLGVLAGCGGTHASSPPKAATVRLPVTFNAVPVYSLGTQPGSTPLLLNAATTPIYLARANQMQLVQQLQKKIHRVPRFPPYAIVVTGLPAAKPATDAAWLYQQWDGKVGLHNLFFQAGPPTWFTHHPPIWVYPSWQDQCFVVEHGVPSLSNLQSLEHQSLSAAMRPHDLLPGQIWPPCKGN